MTTEAPAPARTGTTYLILREKALGGQDTAVVYEPVEAGIEATSADQALRKWAATQVAGGPGMYVALPARSFKPTKVSFVQTVSVKLG